MPIYLTYILLPFVVLSFGIISKGQQYSFMMIGFIMAVLLLRNRLLKFFFLYVAGWMLIIFYAGMMQTIPQGLVAVNLRTIIFMMMAVMIYHYVVRHHDKNGYYNAICIGAILQAILCLLQIYGYDPYVHFLNTFIAAKQNLAKTEVVGTLGNPNYVSAYLAISVPFFFRKKWFYFLLLIIPIILWSRTSTAVISLAAGLIFYFRPVEDRTKRAWAIIIPGLVCLVAYYITYVEQVPLWSHRLRYAIWGDAIGQVLTNNAIVFGLGPGALWAKLYPMHSEWVTMFHHFGLVGIGFATLYIATAARNNEKLYAAFIIAAINMLGNHALHLPPVAFLIIIIMALLEREKYGQLSHISGYYSSS